MAKQYERAAKAVGSKQRVRAVLSEFISGHFGGDGLAQVTTREWCGQWLGARKAETSPATFRRYGDAVRVFLAYCGPRARRNLEEVERHEIVGFRDAMLRQRSAATTNGYVKIIRRIFRNARQDGLIIADPAEGVRAVRASTEEARRPFTLDELRAVIAVADPEWGSIIRFGIYTGQRLGDISRLTWGQIDMTRGEIRFKAAKTGRRTVIPIATTLRGHLIEYAGDVPLRGPIHPRAHEIVTTQNGRVGTLSNQFRALLVAAGLRDPQPHRSRGIGRSGKRAASELTFHSLRHTLVSLLKGAGVADAVTLELAGHESLGMSRLYTHVGQSPWPQRLRHCRSIS